MSFTQENKTNISICDGCEKRCKLGYYEETEQEAKARTTNARRLATTLPVKRFVWPTIDGKEIISFFDKYGEPQQCVFESEFLHLPYPHKVKEYKQKILEKAHEIAKLCDHYKTR